MAESIGSIIQAWLRQNNLEEDFREKSVPDYWTEIVGETFARHAVLERVEHRRMVIKTENATWKMEILARREEIRRRVNERFGVEVIDEVFVI